MRAATVGFLPEEIVAAIESEAFVLIRHPLTESSWIVSFFTRSDGVVRGVAKGGRRTKSPFRGILEPFNRIMVELGSREGSELATVRVADLLEGSMGLYGDWSTASVLMVMAELLDRGLPEHAAEEETYRLTGTVLDGLRLGVDPVLVWLYFQVWFLTLHGIFPKPRGCARCGGDLAGGARLDPDSCEWFCNRCRAAGEGEGLTMEEGALKLLAAIFASTPAKMPKERAAEPAVRELQVLVDRLLGGYLGRPLATWMAR